MGFKNYDWSERLGKNVNVLPRPTRRDIFRLSIKMTILKTFLIEIS